MDKILQALEQITQALGTLTTLQTKGVTGTPTWTPVHGPGGLFSTYGLEDVVVNASLTPVGIDRVLTAIPTVYTNPLFPFLTGFESDDSAEPSGPCANCPGGIMEGCVQTATFGRICRESQEVEINHVQRLLNRGETAQLRLMGEVLGDSKLIPQGLEPADWLNLTTRVQMVIVGIQLQRAIAPMIWTGNPANNVGTGYMEFPGFDMLISTGKVDAISGVTCPALDSDVKDFDFNDVCGVTPDIVEFVSMMEYYLRHVADRAHLSPVEWVIAMRPELWIELTACWPCKYLINRCISSGFAPGITQTAVINDTVNQDLRNEMRNGNFLWVNGRRIPVITDDGIFEENSATSEELDPGEFASDIYFVPLRARGMTAAYFEFLDYSKSQPDTAMLQGKESWWVTDGGMYMWVLNQLMWCYTIAGKIEPRLILRTPHLAGRIQNVKYVPMQHLRTPFEGPYFVKGGVEQRSVPTYYSEWNPPRG